MPKMWIDGVTVVNGEKIPTRSQVIICGKCKDYGEERLSLGIFAGYYCDKCWDESGMRKEGREGFSPLDAGEAYEPEDY